jgi:hypothetical protein
MLEDVKFLQFKFRALKIEKNLLDCYFFGRFFILKSFMDTLQ